MNDKMMQDPLEEQIRQSYGVPEVRAGFKNHLESELMRRAELKRSQSARQAPRWRFALAAAAVFLLLALFFTAAPQGRALAETIGHLFKVATVTEIPIEAPASIATPTFAPGFAATLAPVVEATPTAASAPVESSMPEEIRAACEDEPNGYTCSLYRAEMRAGYNLKEFPTDPDNMRFMEYYVWDNHDVQISYMRVTGGAYLLLTQGMGGEFRPTTAGVPEDAIQAVEVNGFRGEYVVGNYFAGSGETAYKWQYSGTYRLRWADGERWYEIRYDGCMGPDDLLCSADGLIRLGESLVDSPTTSGESRATACEEDPYGYACKIYWAEKRAGFDLREFPNDPIDMRFQELHVGENKDVYIRYERIGGGTFLIFNQGLGEEFNSGGMGVPADAIQPVMVGKYPGEYAAGGYVIESGAKTFSWSADAKNSLRWKEGERWFEIQYWGCVGREDYCSAEGLVQMALTLVDKPQPAAGPRADYLQDIAEAEQISGLDLLEPAILPEGFVFSYGTYNAENGQVMLSYQPVGYPPSVAEVSIRQQAGDTLPIPPKEEKFESIEVHGNPAIYQSSGPYSHWITWQENGKIISIAVVSSDLWYGGTFTREQVLEIAQSMH